MKKLLNIILSIYEYLKTLTPKLIDFLYKLALAIILDVLLVYIGVYVYIFYISDYGIDIKVHQIYRQIIVASGQSNVILPLYIVDEDIDNAYCDGEKIVIYRGLINKSSWDQIAWTLAHELAHYQLGHNTIEELYDNTITQEKSEALADKLGSFFMLKAGYDLCAAREEWAEYRDTQGDFLGENHPPHSYRYDALKMPWCN